MALMSTCLARLGSRFSLILDPVRREVHYGALGLMRQGVAQMVIGLDDRAGNFACLPLAKQGQDFFNVDQRLTATSVLYDANSLSIGANLHVEIIAPFWPQDERTSLVPAYILRFRVSPIKRSRWTAAANDARRKGVVRFGLKLDDAKIASRNGMLSLTYPVSVGGVAITGEGGQERQYKGPRQSPVDGQATDLIVPLDGPWKVRNGMLEVPFDVTTAGSVQEFSLAIVSHCDSALFERFGQPMQFKYIRYWPTADATAAFVRKNHKRLVEKSRDFDAILADSSLPVAAQDLTCLSFQSYLMNTMWCWSKQHKDWFSVWEGSCWFNSTVDVTYNEAMFYFACWPQLLEMIFKQWSHHVNDAPAELARRRRVAKDPSTVHPGPEGDFPGGVLEHDMGSGWTANGQSYPHAMPVEENSNWLLLLYAHGKWWGREELFRKYAAVNRQLVEYLLWTDSTGNGFPDRGTANTIDDATPAVQYGRDNVYLGVKRLAALHAAYRMFDATGDRDLSRRCQREVAKAIRTLNAGWLGDHWGVCLDKTTTGLIDPWTAKPLPYEELPGWDAYSLYTTNGLLPLIMVDDLPRGLDAANLRTDLVNACRESMLPYGCGHSSRDLDHVWISMNVWRDCVGGYLGENMLHNCERYWNQQLFGNTLGSEKPNCFTETSLTNNLVWYPRGAAVFGLLLSTPGLKINRAEDKIVVTPRIPGRWPLLPLADWDHGDIPVMEVDPKNTQGE